MKLFDYYQVAWTDKGVKRYGVVRNDDEAKANFAKGLLTVEDAVMPTTNIITIKDARPLKCEYGGEYDKYVRSQYDEAQKLSDSLKGLVAGRLFDIGVGDGSAWYVVTQVGRTATIEWRGFCLDRYVDQVLGYGGTFPKRTIERLVGRTDGLRRIFGR